ncbi:winged helix-turn-helix domain-containing protein [Streptomyces sp. NPDC008163]|uniref:winged helix-turn-helix domain-containing protein n=1 Tax=Streptomyces sp. NPDC008163 TaxID=3364818 RepID=UPI0036E69786
METPDLEGMRRVLRSLRCLQLDPINAVAPSHQLVLWSRLGAYERSDLEALLWRERWLFEYWAHAASIVLTDDFAIHRATMRQYPRAMSNYGRRVAAWMEANEGLRSHIMERLKTSGATRGDGFEDVAVQPWASSGWTAGRNVERMLDILWLQGHVTVAGRAGRARVWDLTERCLPEAVAAEEAKDEEVVRTAAECALKALGVARAADISRHFTRDRYPGLEAALSELEHSGAVLRVEPSGFGRSGERWYVHRDRLAVLEGVMGKDWLPRTVMLSPFDNLICDRQRTSLLWDFDFRNEMYVPKAKRQYGYYLMPILHGERLIGRVAPRMDRRRKVLKLEGVFAEPDAPGGAAVEEGIGQALKDLAKFAGAESVDIEGPVPMGWRKAVAQL